MASILLAKLKCTVIAVTPQFSPREAGQIRAAKYGSSNLIARMNVLISPTPIIIQWNKLGQFQMIYNNTPQVGDTGATRRPDDYLLKEQVCRSVPQLDTRGYAYLVMLLIFSDRVPRVQSCKKSLVESLAVFRRDHKNGLPQTLMNEVRPLRGFALSQHRCAFRPACIPFISTLPRNPYRTVAPSHGMTTSQSHSGAYISAARFGVLVKLYRMPKLPGVPRNAYSIKSCSRGGLCPFIYTVVTRPPRVLELRVLSMIWHVLDL